MAPQPFSQVLALFLCLALALPNPALALRPRMNPAGLEQRLLESPSAAGAEEGLLTRETLARELHQYSLNYLGRLDNLENYCQVVPKGILNVLLETSQGLRAGTVRAARELIEKEPDGIVVEVDPAVADPTRLKKLQTITVGKVGSRSDKELADRHAKLQSVVDQFWFETDAYVTQWVILKQPAAAELLEQLALEQPERTLYHLGHWYRMSSSKLPQPVLPGPALEIEAIKKGKYLAAISRSGEVALLNGVELGPRSMAGGSDYWRRFQQRADSQLTQEHLLRARLRPTLFPSHSGFGKANLEYGPALDLPGLQALELVPQAGGGAIFALDRSRGGILKTTLTAEQLEALSQGAGQRIQLQWKISKILGQEDSVPENLFLVRDGPWKARIEKQDPRSIRPGRFLRVSKGEAQGAWDLSALIGLSGSTWEKPLVWAAGQDQPDGIFRIFLLSSNERSTDSRLWEGRLAVAEQKGTEILQWVDDSGRPAQSPMREVDLPDSSIARRRTLFVWRGIPITYNQSTPGQEGFESLPTNFLPLPAAGAEETYGHQLQIQLEDRLAPFLGYVWSPDEPAHTPDEWNVDFEDFNLRKVPSDLHRRVRAPATHLVRGPMKSDGAYRWWTHLHLILFQPQATYATPLNGLLVELVLDNQGRIIGIQQPMAELFPSRNRDGFVELPPGLRPEMLLDKMRQAVFESGPKWELEQAIKRNRPLYALAESVDLGLPRVYEMVRIAQRRSTSGLMELFPQTYFKLHGGGIYRRLDKPVTKQDAVELAALSAAGAEEDPETFQRYQRDLVRSVNKTKVFPLSVRITSEGEIENVYMGSKVPQIRIGYPHSVRFASPKEEPRQYRLLSFDPQTGILLLNAWTGRLVGIDWEGSVFPLFEPAESPAREEIRRALLPVLERVSQKDGIDRLELSQPNSFKFIFSDGSSIKALFNRKNVILSTESDMKQRQIWIQEEPLDQAEVHVALKLTPDEERRFDRIRLEALDKLSTFRKDRDSLYEFYGYLNVHLSYSATPVSGLTPGLIIAMEPGSWKNKRSLLQWIPSLYENLADGQWSSFAYRLEFAGKSATVHFMPHEGKLWVHSPASNPTESQLTVLAALIAKLYQPAAGMEQSAEDKRIGTVLNGARRLAREGMPQEALAAIEDLHREFPDHPKIITQRANLLFQTKRFSEAAALMEPLVNQQQEQGIIDPTAHTVYAKILSQTGRLTEAESVFRKVLSVEANHLPATHVGARILNRQGRYNEAKELVAPFQANPPQGLWERFQLAQLLEEVGEAQAAREVVESLEGELTEAPEWSRSLNRLKRKLGMGNFSFKRGREDKKSEAFNVNLLRSAGATYQRIRNMHVAQFPAAPKDQDPLWTAPAKQLFAEMARKAIKERGVFNVALSGGHTPEALYRALADDQQIEWRRIHIFWVDEHLPRADKARSGFEVVFGSLLKRIQIPDWNVHPFDLTATAHRAEADRYESEVRKILGDQLAFDLMILGMGTDGHIMSLLPHSNFFTVEDPALIEVVERSDVEGGFAYTMTPLFLERARHILLLVSGEGKQEAWNAFLKGNRDPKELPVALLDGAKSNAVYALAALPQAGAEEDWKEKEQAQSRAVLEELADAARGPVNRIAQEGTKIAVFVDAMAGSYASAAELDEIAQGLRGFNGYPLIEVKPMITELIEHYRANRYQIIQLKVLPQEAASNPEVVYLDYGASERLIPKKLLPLMITDAVALWQRNGGKSDNPLILQAPPYLNVDDATQEEFIKSVLSSRYA